MAKCVVHKLSFCLPGGAYKLLFVTVDTLIFGGDGDAVWPVYWLSPDTQPFASEMCNGTTFQTLKSTQKTSSNLMNLPSCVPSLPSFMCKIRSGQRSEDEIDCRQWLVNKRLWIPLYRYANATFPSLSRAGVNVTQYSQTDRHFEPPKFGQTIRDSICTYRCVYV